MTGRDADPGPEEPSGEPPTHRSRDRYLGSETDIDKMVGQNVQRYRLAKGLSQAELAAALSARGEHVHQQTIQKLEKGARSLKYSEAIRIGDVLKINSLHLADGDKRAQANADFMETLGALNKMQADLRDFADRLAPILVDLAHLLVLKRSGNEGCQPDDYLVDWAESWLESNWGKSLNAHVMDSLREHPDLTELHARLDAPTYGEVLKRLAETELEPFQPDDPDLRPDDASEA